MTANKSFTKVKSFIVLLSAALFLASLTQTGLTYQDFDGQKRLSSGDLLLTGAFAFLGGGVLETLIWLANLFYVAALFLFYRSKNTSSAAALVGTVLALLFLGWDEILVSESGKVATIIALNAGYWLWMLSLASLTVGTIYYFNKVEKGSMGNDA